MRRAGVLKAYTFGMDRPIAEQVGDALNLIAARLNRIDAALILNEIMLRAIIENSSDIDAIRSAIEKTLAQVCRDSHGAIREELEKLATRVAANFPR